MYPSKTVSWIAGLALAASAGLAVAQTIKIGIIST